MRHVGKAEEAVTLDTSHRVNLLRVRLFVFFTLIGSLQSLKRIRSWYVRAFVSDLYVFRISCRETNVVFVANLQWRNAKLMVRSSPIDGNQFKATSYNFALQAIIKKKIAQKF